MTGWAMAHLVHPTKPALELNSYKFWLNNSLITVAILLSFNLSILSHKHAKECSDLVQMSCIHKSPHVASYSRKSYFLLLMYSVEYF